MNSEPLAAPIKDYFDSVSSPDGQTVVIAGQENVHIEQKTQKNAKQDSGSAESTDSQKSEYKTARKGSMKTISPKSFSVDNAKDEIHLVSSEL